MPKPPTWITYCGGPLDGAFEKRPHGARLSDGRDEIGQPITTSLTKHQRRRIAEGRDGTKHYLLAPIDGDTAVYVHAAIYRHHVTS